VCALRRATPLIQFVNACSTAQALVVTKEAKMVKGIAGPGVYSATYSNVRYPSSHSMLIASLRGVAVRLKERPLTIIDTRV
jgi:hypothetical protein